MNARKVFLLSLGAGLVALGVLRASAAEDAHNSGKKREYLIELKHTPEQCLNALDQTSAEAPKLLESIRWGCLSGDHTGYLIVSAESEKAARAMLPGILRDDARVVGLNIFSAQQIKSFHQKK